MSRLPTLGARGEGWVIIQFALLGLIGLAGIAGPAWGADVRAVTTPLGLILAIAGLAMALLGLRGLGRNLTPLPYPRDGALLIETGIYGRVRHPIYGGIIVGSLGWAVATASLVAILLAVVLVGFFSLKARREEAWLATRFAGYAAYRERTRAFIPFPGGRRAG